MVHESELCEWLNGISLSRQKKNLARDFSDGVLMAEILKIYYPRHVELHNYSMANSFEKKLRNWELLNKKVLSVIGHPQSQSTLKKIASCCKGAIEELLIKIKKNIENTLALKKNDKGELICGFLKGDSGEELNSDFLRSYNIVSLKEYNKLDKVLKSKIEELNSASAKIKHLESLLDLKNQRIHDLSSQLKMCHHQSTSQ